MHSYMMTVSYFSIEVVRETGNKLALNWLLTCEQGEVVGQFLVGRNDGSFAVVVKLRSSGTAKDLEYVQDP